MGHSGIGSRSPKRAVIIKQGLYKISTSILSHCRIPGSAFSAGLVMTEYAVNHPVFSGRCVFYPLVHSTTPAVVSALGMVSVAAFNDKAVKTGVVAHHGHHMVDIVRSIIQRTYITAEDGGICPDSTLRGAVFGSGKAPIDFQ